MYKNKFLIALVAAVLFASCKTDDKLVDEILATVERGAIVRTISSEGLSMNVVDESSALTLLLEAQDEQDGGLLREVRFYASFIDNTAGNDNSQAEVLLRTAPASEWAPGDFGLPRTTFSTTLAELASVLGGLEFGDYNCGDEFNIRLELELTDGRVWTNTDLAGTVAGGSFFASPLNYRITLAIFLPSDDLYTGDYDVDFGPGGFGVDDYADGTYTIGFVDAVTRVIPSVSQFPAFGGFGPVDLNFSFVCDEIVFGGDDTGVGCGGSIVHTAAEVNTTFDPVAPDDSSFIVNYLSSVDDGGCGLNATPETITFTKI
ncbi:MAG: hypothetical protein ABF293_07045 [Flavobacteriaceae bacterium]